jgi:hypothetical protein
MSKKEKRKISKGTGKRYESSKPRPLTEPAPRVRPPEPTYAEKVLRKRIPEFAYHGERFRDDFQRALEYYFEQKPSESTPLTFDESELPGFQEWYFFDYVTHSGKRIIDLFAEEVGPRLNNDQRAMLEDWLVWNRARLLEFQEVRPGIGVIVQDLLSEEVFEVNDISASYTASRWEIGLLRPIRSAGRVSFTGSAMLLPPREKEGILKTARKLWKIYSTKYPQASLSDFYRDNSLALGLACKRAQEEAAEPPTPFSAEGHELVLSRARYHLRAEAAEIEAALDATEEFINAGPSEEHPDALHYNWIQRGRSHVPKASRKFKKHSVMLRTEWTQGAGQPSYLNLGDMSLAETWLELECVSRERLKAGKALLESTLGARIKHIRDHFDDWDLALEKSDTQPVRPRRKMSRREAKELENLDKEMIRRFTKDWLDQPTMDGKLTPRQAAKTPKGRKRVIEALKQIEYINDQRAQNGQSPTMDADLIRRELGL